MSEIRVRRADIEALTDQLDGLSAPGQTGQLLSSVVAAVRDAMKAGTDEVTVTVRLVASVEEQFGDAFTADESGFAAPGVAVAVAKVGR